VTPIDQAINVGPVLGGELRQVGIESLERLRELGYREAWRRLHVVAPERDCTHSLLALAGAIRGVRWMELPEDERARIRAEANELAG
jgi:DNA transformation protein